jgi:hypothetical protein
MMNTKFKTQQIKINKREEAELHICKSAQNGDGKHTGVRALLTVVGPLKIAIAIRKRAVRPI